MKIKFLSIIVFVGFVCSVSGQSGHGKYHRPYVDRDTVIVAAYMDSLSAYRLKVDSLSRLNDSLRITDKPDARFFRIFAPLTFYYSVAGCNMGLEDCGADDVNTAIDKALMTAYVRCPEYVVNTEKELQEVGALHEEITVPIRNKVKYTAQEKAFFDENPDVPLDIVVEKPNFWTFGGDYYLQFLQNYVSGNWYKGGESNYSMVASATLQANYNNKQKVKFENKLEMKLGFRLHGATLCIALRHRKTL